MSSFKSQNHDALFLTKQKLLDDDDFSSKKKRVSRDEDPCSIKKKKRKKDKKSKKKKSKRSHRNHSPSKSSSGSDESDEWVEMVDEGGKTKNEEKSGVRSGDIDREDWMSMTGAFATFSRKDLKPDQDNMKKKKGQIDEYNPAQCSRELNPYWRDGGTGLPSTRPDKPSPPREYTSNRREPNKQFRRPHHSDDYGNKYDERRRNRDDSSYYHETSGNWKKPREPIRNRSISPARNDDTRERPPTSEIEASTSQLASNIKTTAESEGVHHYLSDEQMNALGAKIVKAEILGNTKLISELTSKLEAARAYKKLHPAGPPGQEEGAAVMLTMTDERGNTRPLSCPQSTGDPRSKGGKKKAVTHSDGGDRMKFFADDDKYSLKELFEKEKFGSAQDDEREFSEIVAKHTNPNDELEDIFTEKIMKNMSDAKRDQLNLNKAISQHKRSEKSMEACEYCLDSDKMIKHMMASLGSRAYVALPTRKSLTEGHCYISTVGHVACSTMVDEDVWAEILSYRRALTRMFNAQDEDVVFFETAVYFHKHPHLVIHCVPLPRDVGDTAPIYFKKALLECEAEWSNNKKVVDLRGKDIRRGVPKGLPYFWIDFGMDPGFAHVIEDQQLFPNNFAQEIIGGMLDLDHSLWRKPHRENFEAQRKKVVQFATEWKKYDPAVGQ